MNFGLIGILLALAIPVPCTEALIEDDVVYEIAPSKSVARPAIRRKPAEPPPASVTALRPSIPDRDPSPSPHAGIGWSPRLLSRPPPL